MKTRELLEYHGAQSPLNQMFAYAGLKLFDEVQVSIKDGEITFKKISQREVWIKKNCERFICHSNSTFVVHGNFIIVQYKEKDQTYLGAALCSKTDKFDTDTGIAVATARAFGEEIPDYI